jgi:hypothetical protein
VIIAVPPDGRQYRIAGMVGNGGAGGAIGTAGSNGLNGSGFDGGFTMVNFEPPFTGPISVMGGGGGSPVTQPGGMPSPYQAGIGGKVGPGMVAQTGMALPVFTLNGFNETCGSFSVPMPGGPTFYGGNGGDSPNGEPGGYGGVMDPVAAVMYPAYVGNKGSGGGGGSVSSGGAAAAFTGAGVLSR